MDLTRTWVIRKMKNAKMLAHELLKEQPLCAGFNIQWEHSLLFLHDPSLDGSYHYETYIIASKKNDEMGRRPCYPHDFLRTTNTDLQTIAQKIADMIADFKINPELNMVMGVQPLLLDWEYDSHTCKYCTCTPSP